MVKQINQLSCYRRSTDPQPVNRETRTTKAEVDALGQSSSGHIIALLAQQLTMPIYLSLL